MKNNIIPLWIKISYTVMVCVIVPVYTIEYGPTNFLWLSDVAMLLMVPALWLENRFISSMLAIGVLPLEIIWMIAFCSGGTIFHMADYMFDPKTSIFLRGLSLFHFPMPAVIILMLMRFGYDKRALPAQIILTIVVLSATYLLTKPSDNVNWVFGFDQVQTTIPPLAHLALLMGAIISFSIVPMHFLLSKINPKKHP